MYVAGLVTLNSVVLFQDEDQTDGCGQGCGFPPKWLSNCRLAGPGPRRGLRAGLRATRPLLQPGKDPFPVFSPLPPRTPSLKFCCLSLRPQGLMQRKAQGPLPRSKHGRQQLCLPRRGKGHGGPTKRRPDDDPGNRPRARHALWTSRRDAGGWKASIHCCSSHACTCLRALRASSDLCAPSI